MSGTTRRHGFAVDLQHQAQHAVSGGMLRAHVEDHGAIARTLFQTRLDERRNGEVRRVGHDGGRLIGTGEGCAVGLGVGNFSDWRIGRCCH